MKKLSRTAKFYRDNPKSKKKKKAYDDKLSKRRDQMDKRNERKRKRRAAKKRGKNISGKDYDHATKRFVSPSVNRGRKGEGGRKKKVNKKR